MVLLQESYYFKALIGITPGGVISYVSPLFSGSVSDKEVTCSSGFMDLLQPGDSIMAGKGFNMADICEKCSVVLNIPSYLGKDSQLQERDRIETRRIASLRVHVERVMLRIKRYHILGSISSSWYTLADNLVFICSMLGNWHPRQSLVSFVGIRLAGSGVSSLVQSCLHFNAYLLSACDGHTMS